MWLRGGRTCEVALNSWDSTAGGEESSSWQSWGAACHGDGGFGVSGLLLASSSSAASGNQLGVGFYCCKDAFISMEIAIRSQIPAEDSIEVAGFLLQVPQELRHD